MIKKNRRHLTCRWRRLSSSWSITTAHQGLLFLAAIFATGFTGIFAAFSAGLAFV